MYTSNDDFFTIVLNDVLYETTTTNGPTFETNENFYE